METTETSVYTLSLGSEIMYSSDILDKLTKNPDLRINGGNYVFIEFPTEISIYEMRNAAVKVIRSGFIPVIAHIEAYTEILKKPNFVWDLREYGALIHVNASSVAKMRFGKISHFLKYLFSKSYIDVVTESSCKDEKDKNDIEKAKAKITRLFGEDMAVNVTESTPKAIINNERLLRY
jgi:protein-tyrosine phosphatase